MTLGDIIAEVVNKDLSFPDKRNKLVYREYMTDDKFCIELKSKFEEANIECSVLYNGKEEEKNYARAYFLSMVFNAAIHGMKRMKHKKNKRHE